MEKRSDKYRDLSLTVKIENSFKYLEAFNNEPETVVANIYYEMFCEQWNRHEFDIKNFVNAAYYLNPKADSSVVLKAIKEVMDSGSDV